MYSTESFLVYLASPQLKENQKQNARNPDFPARDRQRKSGNDSNSRSVEYSFLPKMYTDFCILGLILLLPEFVAKSPRLQPIPFFPEKLQNCIVENPLGMTLNQTVNKKYS